MPSASILLADVVLLLVAAAACSVAVDAIFPLLQRYALARPNARSSHRTPTAQGGGFAVVGAALLAAWIGVAVSVPLAGGSVWQLALVSIAMVLLAALGAVDDVRPLPVAPRLGLQFAAAAIVLMALPPEGRALPILPYAVEMAIVLVGLVWFVNLTNFMDGIDGITVAEFVPVLGALAVLTHMGSLPPVAGILALALAGALIGFAPYNRHVARLFLGDVGSLAIGAAAGWILVILAGRDNLAAALLLPMYYLADATVTLVRRWLRGEKLSEAHRQHAYQRATERGFTVPDVTRAILRLNVALAALAISTVALDSRVADIAALAAGGLATALTIRRLERGTP